MPSLCNRHGKPAWRGSVMVFGTTRRKWFPDGSKASQRAATVWEEEKRKALLKDMEVQPAPPTPTDCLSLLAFGNEYLTDGKLRWQSQKTYDEKRSALGRLVAFCGPESFVRDIGPDQARKMLLKERKARSGYAANKDRKNLGHAWEWGRKFLAEFPKDRLNPFLLVEKFPEERAPRYVPPEEDFWTAFALTKGQDRVLLTAFLHLAARRGELFRLTWEDVDFINGQVALKTMKTRNGSWKVDNLPMTDELRSALLGHWEGRQGSGHVFTVEDSTPFTSQHQGRAFKCRQHFMRKLCSDAEVKRFGFHAIRHLSATILYRDGYQVAVIQRILRHESPSTTERYLKSLGLDVDGLRQVVRTFDGRGKGRVVPMKKAHGMCRPESPFAPTVCPRGDQAEASNL